MRLYLDTAQMITTALSRRPSRALAGLFWEPTEPVLTRVRYPTTTPNAPNLPIRASFNLHCRITEQMDGIIETGGKIW